MSATDGPKGHGLAVNGETSVTAGQPITLDWAANPSGAKDWIGLFKVGDPDTATEFWKQVTNEANMGKFVAPAPNISGQVEFRYFAGTTRTSVARSNTVTVAATMSTYTLTPSGAEVEAGGPMMVSYTADPGGLDWIGLWKVGVPSSGQQFWYEETFNKTSGTMMLKAPPTPGDYEFRYIPHNTRTEVAKSSVVKVSALPVMPPAPPPEPGELNINTWGNIACMGVGGVKGHFSIAPQVNNYSGGVYRLGGVTFAKGTFKPDSGTAKPEVFKLAIEDNFPDGFTLVLSPTKGAVEGASYIRFNDGLGYAQDSICKSLAIPAVWFTLYPSYLPYQLGTLRWCYDAAGTKYTLPY